MVSITDDCYGEKIESSSELETDFTQLDNFIMSQYSQISFMQYKMIEHSVSKNIRNNSNFYSGETKTDFKEISFNAFSYAVVKVKLEESNEYINSDELIVQKTYVLFPELIQEFKQDVTYLNNEVEQEKKTVKKLGLKHQRKICKSFRIKKYV